LSVTYEYDLSIQPPFTSDACLVFYQSIHFRLINPPIKLITALALHRDKNNQTMEIKWWVCLRLHWQGCQL